MKLLQYSFLIVLISCQQSKNLDSKTKIININLSEDAIENSTAVNLSNIVSNVEYLQLENTPFSMLGRGTRLFVFDSLIVSSGHRQIYIFNKYTGNFIREIGEQGRGPSSYWNSTFRIKADKERGIVIDTGGWNYSLKEFSTDGRIIGKVKLAKHTSFVTHLNDNLYAAYYINHTGNEKERIVIWDNEKKKIVKRFGNYRTFKNTPSIKRFFCEGLFYRFNEKLLFKEYLCDTIYHITEKEMIPHIVFNSGKYSPPYDERETFDFTKYHGISTIIETQRYLLFKFFFQKKRYYCYYDKQTYKLQLSIEGDKKEQGFINDVDGFARFRPESVTKDNEIIGYIEAYQLVKWMKDNPDKVANLPDHLKKFKDIKESDNPIVMIAKLKE
ncbi:6-bladed beta-propeller [Puteibacter caeruleilacunae]|nr:6-bladed beta-propeller [Puteibacter caeruleilacunae]